MRSVNSVKLVIRSIKWPHINKDVLLRGQKNGTEFLLETDSSSRLVCTVTRGYIKRQFISQPIVLTEPGEFEILIEFDSNTFKVSIYIHNLALLSSSEANGRQFLVKTTSYVPDRINYPDLSVFHPKDESEFFFIRTINDLLKRFKSTDLYETIKIAGLLRLLLLDNPCLIDVVNKKYKLRLEYKASDHRIHDKSGNYTDNIAAYYSLYASQLDKHSAPSKVRNAFVKVPCAMIDGQSITIEDIILYCAHKAGGVHYDQSLPNKPGQLKVLELVDLLKNGSSPQYNELLHEITFLTLQGVQPLVTAIIEAAIIEAQK